MPAAVVRATVIGGLTTSAAPPTISGKAKKNGLAWPPVSATSRVATVIATEPSTTNLAGPSASAGRRSWTITTNTAGQGEQDEDRGLGLRPQPGRHDDDAGGQDEHPGHDADDAVVGLRRDAVVSRGTGDPADDRRLRGTSLGVDRRLVGAATGLDAAEHRRDDDQGHQDEVGEDRGADQDQDRSDGHARPRWFQRDRPDASRFAPC